VGSPSKQYGSAAIALHWLTALLVVANLGLGLSMVPLPISPRKLEWYMLHKSIGVSVFVLACVRLALRTVRPPPPAVTMPDWQRRAATAVHVLLYALLLAVPVSGWIYSSSTGVQVIYLGAIPLPDLVPKDRALAGVLKAVHVSLNATLAALTVLHVGAALKHHFSDHDAVLVRMLPWARLVGRP
jgi:cytochrome b561